MKNGFEQQQQKVSLIVAIYNVDKYLDKCILSILKQTYNKLEIILVNDGSTDKSLDICYQYAKLDSRIRIVNKSNGGLSDARNCGINNAKGEYICFIDGDDYIEPDMIEALISEANRAEYEVVMFGSFNDTVNSNEELIRSSVEIVDLDNTDSLFQIVGYAWNKIYKATLLKDAEIYYEKGLSLIEDVVFNEMVFKVAKKIGVLKKPLYHYMNRPNASLVKQYHKDVYLLMKRGLKARKSIITQLLHKENDMNSILAQAHLTGIRYCCASIYYYNSGLSFREKYMITKEMILDAQTQTLINILRPSMKSEWIYKILIKLKASIILSLMYYTLSGFRKIS